MNRVLFSSASDRHATPRAVYEALDAEFHFDFDPCPLDGEGDGLAPLFCEWKGKRVFCNPPYSPGLPTPEAQEEKEMTKPTLDDLIITDPALIAATERKQKALQGKIDRKKAKDVLARLGRQSARSVAEEVCPFCGQSGLRPQTHFAPADCLRFLRHGLAAVIDRFQHML